MRDLLKLAEGVEIPADDDMTMGEMCALVDKLAEGPSGVFDALSAAYLAGWATGRKNVRPTEQKIMDMLQGFSPRQLELAYSAVRSMARGFATQQRGC